MQIFSPLNISRSNTIFLGFCVGLVLLSLGSCSTGTTGLSRELLPVTPAASSQVPSNPVSESKKVEEESASIPSFQFEWPVEDARFVRGFLPQKKRPHWGVDLAAPRGTPIYSAQSGMVIYAGRDFKGYGKMVLIESGKGWATLYAHMDKILVDEGQTVTTKSVLGLMGRTGRATGVHLHFEIRRGKGPVDPLEFLPGGQRVAGRI